MSKLKNLYFKCYYVSSLDFADSAESNRLFILFWSRLCLLLCFLYLVFDLIVYRGNYYEHRYNLLYLAGANIDLFVAFILSVRFKNVSHEKAYILKNIPLYTIFCYGIGSQVFLFYFNDNPFVNMLGVFFAVTVVLCVFTVSLPFFVLIITSYLTLLPGFLTTFGRMGIVNLSFLILVFIFLGFFNRYKAKQYLDLLKKQKGNLEAKTFGNFTLTYQGKRIPFARKKSEELLGYLIYKKGTSVTTKELISVLWDENSDSSGYGSNFRNIVADIKHTLDELGIQNFFVKEYNNFRINPEIIKCDYYDFLKGDAKAVNSFFGEFMNQYTWAEETAAFLEQKLPKA